MASDDWQTLPFNQAVDVNPPVKITRGQTYPFVDMKAIEPSSRAAHQSEMREFSGSGARFRDGDTLMARITPCLENGKIARYEAEQSGGVAHGSTEFIVIRGRDSVTTDDFAYYLTRSEETRQKCVSLMTGTSGRQRVPTDSLATFDVMVPPLAAQRRIAHMLGTLDEKIELNRRKNATLESMARALFQSWFVDFDPVRAKAAGQTPSGMDPATADLFPSAFEDSELGEIPKGWFKRRADEFSRVTIGKTPPRKEPEWFSESKVDIPWVSIRDLGTSGIYVSQTSERLTKKGIDRFNVRMVPRDTVILSFKLTVGRVAITDVKLATNEAIAHFGIDPASGVTTEFLYLSLLAFDFDSLGSTSSIATAVNSDSVRSIEICVPPAALIEAFTAIVKPLFSLIRLTQAEIRTLAEARDALLPRFLSGELDSSGVGE